MHIRSTQEEDSKNANFPPPRQLKLHHLANGQAHGRGINDKVDSADGDVSRPGVDAMSTCDVPVPPERNRLASAEVEALGGYKPGNAYRSEHVAAPPYYLAWQYAEIEYDDGKSNTGRYYAVE